ncbi:lipoyl synthase [candidate division WOR-3 bacterium]|nr:lipoyl synthase [candidate division WOR-3 bacterium]
MRKPAWLRTRLPSGPEFGRVNERLRRHGLNTVCSAARCPNLHECWSAGTATFMILGDTCTRHCRFCATRTGNPGGVVDETEPERVAAAVAELGLRYVVLTSVDRDDLDDLGAGVFAAAVRHVRRVRPGAGVEVLTPDFGGREELVRQVTGAGPDVFGHNAETVERLTPEVRDRRASYRRSLDVLATAKRLAPQVVTKSGMMVGLGETDDEVHATMRDLRQAGCDIVTVGQYLQPDRRSLAVQRYVEPAGFDRYRAQALGMGFRAAYCGPLVRSSYHAAEVVKGARGGVQEGDAG